MRDSEFEFIRSLVYEHSRINLTPDKRELVSARLGQRLRAHGFESLTDYCRLLQSTDSADELENLIDVISTNHTFFFRETAHFDFLRDLVCPEMQARATTECWSRFNVWSAATSSGEEAYSIAITLAGCLPNWDWRVVGTDIARPVLARAKTGIYPKDALSKLNRDLVKQHFQRGYGPQEGKYRVKAALRDRVSFRQSNLLDRDVPSYEAYHAIFCRNVMIYFDAATQQELVARLTNRLVPGGYLFVGHSESLTGIRHSLRVIRPAVYQRPR